MAKNRERSPEVTSVTKDIIIPGLTYSSIFNRYADSTFGIHHAKEALRFNEKYGYDRAQMLADLGDDVHPVRHMLHTQKNVAVNLLSAQIHDAQNRFDVSAIQAIRLAATTHDMGEGKHDMIAEKVGPPVGDVTFTDKNDTHAAQERLIRQFLYGQLYPDVPPELLEAAEAVIDTEGTLLGEAFDTIERVGYYKTAMRAGVLALELARQSQTETQRFTKLAKLALEVSDRHHEILGGRGSTFPYARTFLRRKSEDYRSIQNELPGFLDRAA